MLRISNAALAHMKSGGAIVNKTSVNADAPNPVLIAYASTKVEIQKVKCGLAQLIAERGIRTNCVAPGPIWTPPIPTAMPASSVE